MTTVSVPKTLILTFGRFNPPHKGHLILFDFMLDKAIELNADVEVWVSHTLDKKTNLLSPDEKLYYLKLFKPNVRYEMTDKKIHSIIPILKTKDKEYANIVIVVGNDRLEAFTKLLNDYNHIEYNFNKIDVISCAIRDDNNFYSSTLVRKAVKEKDYERFKKLMPSTERIQELYDLLLSKI